MGFMSQLRERNVVKVAVFYMVTGWVLVQAASIALPAFEAPAWVLRVFIFLVLLGFPIALIMAWALELTPDGIRRSQVTVGEKRMWTLTTGLTLLAITWFQFSQPTMPNLHVADNSIAVLPFVDLTAEGDHAYFGDGIAEEILNVLARIPELKVAGRTSSFRFRGEQQDLRSIGEQLDVAKVLEGSIRKSGDQFRITAQLIDTRNGYHLWSQTYDELITASNLFTVQTDIANKVVDEMLLLVSTTRPEPRITLSSRNMQAIRLYWKALEKIRFGDAIPLLENAIALDPGFAEAHIELANQLQERAWVGIEQKTSMARAWEHLAHAEALLPGNPRNHHVRGMLLYRDRFDYEAALQELGRAAELAPSDPRPLVASGWVLRRQQKHEEAQEYFERAYELDPLNAVAIQNLIANLGFNRRNEEAWAILKKAWERLPTDHEIILTVAMFAIRNFSDPESLQKVKEAIPDDMEDREVALGTLALYSEDYEEALRQASFMPPDDADGGRSGYILINEYRGGFHLALGNTDMANAELDKALAVYRQKLQESPDDHRYHDAVARIIGWRGDKVTASKHLDRASRLAEIYFHKDPNGLKEFILHHTIALCAAGFLDEFERLVIEQLEAPGVSTYNELLHQSYLCRSQLIGSEHHRRLEERFRNRMSLTIHD